MGGDSIGVPSGGEFTALLMVVVKNYRNGEGGKPGMWCLIFKNGIVYPIRLVNLAHFITYVNPIDVEEHNTLLNRSDQGHHGPRSGGIILSVGPVPRAGV